MIRAALFFLFLLLSCVRVDAADNYLTFPLRSYHFDRGQGYNENHLGGVGFEAGFARDLRAKAVFFENSKRVDSMFVGASYTPIPLYTSEEVQVRLGALVGKVSGYSLHHLLVALPVARATYGPHGLNVTATPRARGQKGGVGVEYLWTWEK